MELRDAPVLCLLQATVWAATKVEQQRMLAETQRRASHDVCIALTKLASASVQQ